MVTAYLFDNRRGKTVDGWVELVPGLTESQVLWIDLEDPSEAEERSAREALGLGDGTFLKSGDPDGRARLKQYESYLRVTAVGVSDAEKQPERETVVVDCFVGASWVLTVRSAEIAALDDFRAIAEGQGEIGILDAPSFLSAVLEWVVTSYLRAFDEIDESLEEFDVNTLNAPSRDPERQIAMLVDARRRLGRLRRSLAPHRELFSALGHSEFDPISSEQSAERFAQLGSKVDVALSVARDTKDGIAGSFDVLIVRTEHRTSEIIKVLTIVSILLLPGALLAGLAGMNVNFSAQTFETSALFWGVLTAIVVIAITTLGVAHRRRWI